MNDIGELARRSGVTLRDEVADTVDVEASLAALRARQHHHRRSRVVAAVAAAAAVVALLGAAMVARDAGTPAPAPAPAPTVPARCEAGPMVRCLPDGRVRVDASPPYTVLPPEGFDPNVRATDVAVDVYRNDTALGAGVVFIDDVVPARSGGLHLTAHQLARWVAARPFLEADAPVPTTVDGVPGWRVQVTAARTPRDLAESCNRTQPACWPVLGSPRPGRAPWETGPWRDMASRYAFVDLPGGATFAIWSWAFDGNWVAVDAGDELIRTLRFQRS